jgi:hypothetical protein
MYITAMSTKQSNNVPDAVVCEAFGLTPEQPRLSEAKDLFPLPPVLTEDTYEREPDRKPAS